jgi:Flp pilus assembly protein TadG
MIIAALVVPVLIGFSALAVGQSDIRRQLQRIQHADGWRRTWHAGRGGVTAMSRILADDRGVLAVEFALCVPFFALLMIGMMDYGMAALTRSTLDAAARSGLQVMIANPANIAQAQNVATAVAPNASAVASSACICSDGTAVDCAGACAVARPQRIATVAVSQQYALLFPWPGLQSSVTLSAMAKGRVQ